MLGNNLRKFHKNKQFLKKLSIKWGFQVSLPHFQNFPQEPGSLGPHVFQNVSFSLSMNHAKLNGMMLKLL